MSASWTPFRTIITTSADDLDAVAAELIPLLGSRTILLLEGPVGAGKTEFVKRLALKFGISDSSSPSYAIHHRYHNAVSGAAFDHVDLYRLESEDDLESTGFWDLFQSPEGLVVIEWPERMNVDYLPLNWKLIKIRIAKLENSNEREISILIKRP